MSASRRRGEIEAELDGERRVLCLTLGALAELETAFAADDLPALLQRFGTGRLSARDMARIIAAGLRGAGTDVADRDVEAMRADGGAAGFAAIVAELLAVTFGADGGASANPRQPQDGKTGARSPGTK